MATGDRPLRIRVSAKAVIVEDGAVLVTRNDSGDPDGDWFVLPGGGQRPGETLAEAVRREVNEETGLVVDVHELLWVREYRAADYAFAGFDPAEHVVELMFRCTVDEERRSPAPAPDGHQIGIEWMPLADLPERRFYPLGLRDTLAVYQVSRESEAVYLGEMR